MRPRSDASIVTRAAVWLAALPWVDRALARAKRGVTGLEAKILDHPLLVAGGWVGVVALAYGLAAGLLASFDGWERSQLLTLAEVSAAIGGGGAAVVLVVTAVDALSPRARMAVRPLGEHGRHFGIVNRGSAAAKRTRVMLGWHGDASRLAQRRAFLRVEESLANVLDVSLVEPSGVPHRQDGAVWVLPRDIEPAEEVELRWRLREDDQESIRAIAEAAGALRDQMREKRGLLRLPITMTVSTASGTEAVEDPWAAWGYVLDRSALAGYDARGDDVEDALRAIDD